MRKVLFLLLVLLFSMPAFALQVVYPKKTMVNISSDTTFFVGNSVPRTILKINGVPVSVHPSGGFAHYVRLQNGKNVFTLEAGSEKLIYIITKPIQQSSGSYKASVTTDYPSTVNVIVCKDNSPLRSTPVDAGVNRIAHLQTGIPLIVDGESGQFFRVVLSAEMKGWIAKNNVQMAAETSVNEPVTVFECEKKETDYHNIFTFKLDKKTPFAITEGNPLKLSFFNVKGVPGAKYVFNFPVINKLFGYSGEYEGEKFIFKVRKFPKADNQCPLKDLKIVIDPGHGGEEYGAIGCLNNKEKDVNLAISKYLEEELKRRGANVFMTRDKDIFVGLNQRVEYANNNDAALLISIHANALPDSLDPNKHRGTSVYYFYNQAKPLADSILNSMTTTLGTRNDGVRQGSLALVRNTNALSVLIETAYMINPYDNALLMDENFQKKCAKAIADGIENYIKSGGS